MKANGWRWTELERKRGKGVKEEQGMNKEWREGEVTEERWRDGE